MKGTATFVENGDGVHLVSPAEPERTLCGDIFEGEWPLDTAIGQDPQGDFGEMQPTKKRVVTCRACKEIILGCRGIRVA